jgi:hypothetical protein
MNRAASLGFSAEGKYSCINAESARTRASGAECISLPIRGDPNALAVERSRVTTMAQPTSTIRLDPQTVRVSDSAGPGEKRKIQALLSLWLRELAGSEYPSLQQILDEVRQQAKARGLTPEMLDSIPKGA